MKLKSFLKYLSLGTVISSTVISLLKEIDSEDALEQHKLLQESASRINTQIANPPPIIKVGQDELHLANPDDFDQIADRR
jgi:hypothetical protein